SGARDDAPAAVHCSVARTRSRRCAAIPPRVRRASEEKARERSGTPAIHLHDSRGRISVRAVSRRQRLRDATLWLMVLAVTTAILIPFREELDKAHITLVLLLVVLGAGAQGGRALGIGIGAVSFLVFDWFFLAPLHTLVIANPLDWLVLFAFLATSIVAAQLLHREQESARIARAPAAEVDRLAARGARGR